MSQDLIEAYTAALPDVEQSEAYGYTFYFVGADHRRPFVTFASSDNEYDSVSNLDREGVYRVNIGVSRESFERLVGDLHGQDVDYTVLDRFLPHPDYARQHFVCILSPTDERLQTTLELIAEAHAIAARRVERKAARDGDR